MIEGLPPPRQISVHPDGFASIFASLGVLFLLGMLADLLGRRTPLPRVTLLILAGVLVGPGVLDLLPTALQDWFAPVGALALSIVGFLVGGRLTRDSLARNGRYVLYISVAVVVGTATTVGVGLAAVGVPVVLALLLAAMSTATDPAAVMDVVSEAEATGPFSDTLLGVVAVDDAWGLIVFSALIALADTMVAGGGAASVVAVGARELLGAVALGVATGLPMAFLTGRLRPGRPTATEGLGFVFLTLGLALWFEVSFLLSAVVMGAVVANGAAHHRRAFHEIEEIEWPFMILFFLLAGASLDPDALLEVGALGLGYVALRVVGRLVSCHVAERLARTPAGWGRWLGVALLPQAGVALGMALVATEHFPELTDTILPVVIGATVVFEVAGPVLTRIAVRRVVAAPGDES